MSVHYSQSRASLQRRYDSSKMLSKYVTATTFVLVDCSASSSSQTSECEHCLDQFSTISLDYSGENAILCFKFIRYGRVEDDG